ncbi:Hypothetical protein PENO1_097200 [Penicillium occitanis (nom. inval.)]|nr:Hypothetical protein PENO1_097200 [Penicillium occitanis (nom. inval.)]PCG95555.1 hypothetical protein PENOC_077050 [Penicillium occitanis (nom. inval.)]
MEDPNPSHSGDTTDDEENIVEVKASVDHSPLHYLLLTPEKKTQWKQTSPPIIQDLYRTLLHKQRSTIQSFHLWLRLLEHNLMPNARDLTVHYHTVPSLHPEYDLVRIWLNANPDNGLNWKMRVFQILVFSLAAAPSSSTTSSEKASSEEQQKIPWNLFLRDLKHQHELMHDNALLLSDGDYDCFIAYKQYARLYSVQSHPDPECPIIKECWLNFGAEMAQQFGLQPLWKDSNDKGPVWEIKTHWGLICQLLRAFAWNVDIPYGYG